MTVEAPTTVPRTAEAARVLFFVSAALMGLGIITVLVAGLMALTVAVSLVLILILLVGFALNLIAGLSIPGNLPRARVLGIVAVFFPPLNLIALVATILVFISREPAHQIPAHTSDSTI